MKKANKILLSVLTVFSLFLTVSVNAEEIQNEGNLGNQTTQTNLENSKIVNSIEDVKKFIPNNIQLDIKSVDLFGNENYYLRTLYEMIVPKINKVFTDNVKFEDENINSFTYEKKLFNVGTDKMYYELEYSISLITINVYKICGEGENCSENKIQFTKNVAIEYSNSNQYSEEDKLYIENIVNSDLFKTEINTIIPMNVNNDDLLKYYVEKLESALNDNSLKVYLYSGAGSENKTSKLSLFDIAITKNDIVYVLEQGVVLSLTEIIVPEEIVDTDEAYINYALPKLKEIWNDYNIVNVEKYSDNFEFHNKSFKNNGIIYKLSLNGGSCVEGEECFDRVIIRKENKKKIIDNVVINNNSGISIEATKINNEDVIYNEMINTAKEQGYTDVFGSYEFKLTSGSINGKLTITFNLGVEFNGRTALILHKKADGNYEQFIKVVENGQVEIEVSELSPFMVLINEAAPNNAQTASMNIVLYSLATIISLLGITYIIIKSRKKEA